MQDNNGSIIGVSEYGVSMNERGISICYGIAAGAALVQIGVPPLLLIPIAMLVGLAWEVLAK